MVDDNAIIWTDVVLIEDGNLHCGRRNFRFCFDASFNLSFNVVNIVLMVVC
jgi:hypothetical protein